MSSPANQIPKLKRLSFQRKSTPPAEVLPPPVVTERPVNSLLNYSINKFDLVEDYLPPQVKKQIIGDPYRNYLTTVKKYLSWAEREDKPGLLLYKAHLLSSGANTSNLNAVALYELEDRWVKDKTASKRIPDVFNRMRIASLIDKYKREEPTAEELRLLEETMFNE